MRKITRALYDEWGRLDAVITQQRGSAKTKAKAKARKARVGKILSQLRKLEDRKL